MCLRHSLKRGTKAQRFENSDNKRDYVYALTPKWMYDKTKLTRDFIHNKMAEYEHLKEEIESLQTEHF